MNSRRVIATLYFVLFAGFAAGAGALIFDASQEYRQLKAAEAAGRKRLAEAQAQLEKQKQVLERLRHDPVYVEKILRQRTYVQPGDVIFRFPD